MTREEQFRLLWSELGKRKYLRGISNNDFKVMLAQELHIYGGSEFSNYNCNVLSCPACLSVIEQYGKLECGNKDVCPVEWTPGNKGYNWCPCEEVGDDEDSATLYMKWRYETNHKARSIALQIAALPWRTINAQENTQEVKE